MTWYRHLASRRGDSRSKGYRVICLTHLWDMNLYYRVVAVVGKPTHIFPHNQPYVSIFSPTSSPGIFDNPIIFICVISYHQYGVAQPDVVATLVVKDATRVVTPGVGINTYGDRPHIVHSLL